MTRRRNPRLKDMQLIDDKPWLRVRTLEELWEHSEIFCVRCHQEFCGEEGWYLGSGFTSGLAACPKCQEFMK